MSERGKPEDDDLDPPPTEEEIAASERLRDALVDPTIESEEADLARAIRAGIGRGELAPTEHHAMVESALAGDAAADEAEVRSAEELRDLLDARRAGAGPIPELVQALVTAWNPTELSEEEHRAIVARAVLALPTADGREGGREADRDASRRTARVIRVAFGAVGATFAIAASIMLVLKTSRPEDVPLARTRSTQPLFSEPFRPGEASARIDRIAVARASDYRANRFAQWGLK
jgi:hypothetical protein